MEIHDAMRNCEPGGYVARKAYPGRKYYKDENGLFADGQKIDYIDFIAKDWAYYPVDSPHLPSRRFNWRREVDRHGKQADGF